MSFPNRVKTFIPQYILYMSYFFSRGAIITENHMPDIPSSYISNIYESIPATTTIIHEPIHDLNGTLDPYDEKMADNPLYDYRSSEEHFKMAYHLGMPGKFSALSLNISEPIPNTTATIHETIQDLNRNLDPHNDKEMNDNPLYDKSNGEEFKMEYHLGMPGIPSSHTSMSIPNTTAMLHEPNVDQHNDKGMDDNPLYDKSNGEEFKMEYHLGMPGIPSSHISESIPDTTAMLHEPNVDPHNDGEMYDNPLYDKSSGEDFTMEHHLAMPSNPSTLSLNSSVSMPTTTATLHELQDINRTVDPLYDEEMDDNLLYDKSSAENYNIECHRSIPTATIFHNPLCIHDCNETADQHDKDIHDNPLST